MAKYRFKSSDGDGDGNAAAEADQGGGGREGAAPEAAGNAEADLPESDQRVDVQRVDAAIRSDYFWAYAWMIDTIAEMHELVMDWAESCACHWRPVVALRGPDRHRPRQRIADAVRRAKVRCPLSGMRAAELAAGALFEVLEALWNLGQSELLMSRPWQRITVAQRDKLLKIWAKARAHTLFMFRVKTSWWRQLPWALFGLAHHNLDTARACARRCLHLYEVAGVVVRNHHIVLALLAYGSTGRAQVVAFISGVDVHMLPELERWLAKMRFALVVERWIESRHSILSRIFAKCPSAGPLHLGLHWVKESSRKIIDRGSKEVFDALAEACSYNRTAVQVLQNFGFRNHPVIVKLVRENANRHWHLNTKNRNKVVEVLFHCDGHSLMRRFPRDLLQPPPPPPPPPPLPPPPGPPPSVHPSPPSAPGH